MIIKTFSITSAALSVFWFLSIPSYEPVITFFGSVAAFLGASRTHHELAGYLKTKNQPRELKISTVHSQSLISALETASILDRLSILHDFIYSIQSITDQEVLNIMELLSILDRPEALEVMANKIEKPVSPELMKKILKTISIVDRGDVARYLA